MRINLRANFTSTLIGTSFSTLVAHARLLDTIQSQWDSYKRCENLYKSLEVERDLVGVQTTSEATTVASSGSGREKPTGWLASRSRQFIREGLLQKLSKKGYQQRMFFLFSDQLIYASRTNAPFLQFKVSLTQGSF